MIYKCCECGHLFEDGEESHWVEDYGEEFSGCPVCGGTYEETVQCRGCESHHIDVDLYAGYCIGCIGKAMDKTTMTDYLKDKDLETAFYLEEFYKSSIHVASEELIELARGGFLQRVALEKLKGGEDSLAALRKFIVEDACGIYEFAEWLRRRAG